VNAPTQSLSIFETFATERHMQKDALISTLMKVIAPPDTSMEELAAFLQLAHKFDLDPFAKEIFLIKSRGKISTYISIDGYSRLANRDPNYDGAEFTYSQGEDGAIEAVTCSMYRKDRSRPTTVTEFLAECVAPNSEAWRKAPARMLRHRAFIQAVRLAFGISAALDEDTAMPATGFTEPVDISPAPIPMAPKPRRQPPSPESVRKPAKTEEEPVSRETDEYAAFDLSGLLEAMEAAKSVEELKQIYSDFDPDSNLQGDPQRLDIAQNAFISNNKRLAG